ncbi:long-chain acyl-CoA synthetase [Oxalobacteraceae bacterium GrIS 2.11]
MEKIWLNSFPPGVPAEVDVSEFKSLRDMLEWGCERYADLPAFSNQHTEMSYRELDTLSNAFASYLQNFLYLNKGDRVALMMPNLLQYPVALFGVLRAGCVVVNTNPQYTARELHHQLVDSGAVCIVILENFAHTLEEALPGSSVQHVITSRVGDLFHFPKAQIVNFVVEHVRKIVPDWHIDNAIPFPEALQLGANIVTIENEVEANDIAFLQYTGGTTGTPKGAILTHGNIVANLLQISAWISTALKEREEIAVIPLPMYHIFSLIAVLTFFRFGAKSILITNPRDMDGFIKEIRHSKFSVIIGVNTLFNALLHAPHVSEIDTSRLKVAIAGGMAVQYAVAKKWHELFGVPLIEGYGLTEASPIACANRLDIEEFTGTIGLPISSTEVSLRDEAGQEVPVGDLGEICIRGPQIMKGYWKKPEESANVFIGDGWMRTGDLGSMDEHGYIKLVDRKKDIIIVSGFKVFPNEVEQVVMMINGVLEVAAVPAYDERSGHVVKIVVVTNNPGVTEYQILDHCRKNLTGYKVPKHVVLRDQPLPKSPVGKVLRRLVAEQFSAAPVQNKSAESAINST